MLAGVSSCHLFWGSFRGVIRRVWCFHMRGQDSSRWKISNTWKMETSAWRNETLNERLCAQKPWSVFLMSLESPSEKLLRVMSYSTSGDVTLVTGGQRKKNCWISKPWNLVKEMIGFHSPKAVTGHLGGGETSNVCFKLPPRFWGKLNPIWFAQGPFQFLKWVRFNHHLD